MVEDELIASIIRWIGNGLRNESNNNEDFRNAKVELIYKGKGGKNPEIVLRLDDGSEFRMKLSAYFVDVEKSMVADTFGTRTSISTGTIEKLTNLDIKNEDPQD